MICSEFGGCIEEYEVFEEIGKGGFGKVNRARCRNTNKEVAIKKINKISLIDEKFIDRVRQEVSIHSKLEHPSILKLYTFFENNEYVYIVLELCPNGHLEQKIKRIGRPFYEKEAQEYLSQVVDGMLHLHEFKIMHRDLTLTNILLDSNGRVKIADFGLATQIRSPEDKHMTMCGTPNYISPEVASKRSHGLESDVWNFGCLVYTMLVGRPPFEAKFVRATLNNVLYGKYKIPDHLSESAKDLINKCLKKNPRERIQLNHVLRHPFFSSAHDGKGVNSCRSDSGVYTISTNATSHHTKAPLSAVCEDPEYSCSNSVHRSQKYDARNGFNKPLNSPPVKLKSNSYENANQLQQHGGRFDNFNQLQQHGGRFDNFNQLQQHGGRFDQLKKKFFGLPFTSGPPPVDYFHEKMAMVTSKEKDCPYNNGRENSSCMSGRSGKNRVNSIDQRQSYEDYDRRSSRSCDSPEDRPHINHNPYYQEENYGIRNGRPNLRTDGSLRRSISSDGRILSNENKFFHGARSSSLDRERYEEEMYKDKKVRTHSADCQCLVCIPKNHQKHLSTCSCHESNSHRSCCNKRSESSNKCGKSPSKYSTKSSGSSGRNTDILKDIAPVKRPPSPPLISPQPLFDPQTVFHKSPVTKQHPISGNEQKLRGKCSPLSTRRIKPTKQFAKNVILNILEDGEVCVQFLYKRSGHRVYDVCRISHDGMQITWYKPNGSNGVPVSDSPPAIPIDGAAAIFDYDDLPKRYWNKYIYAARFVNMVKARTPKITYYSEEARCFLMENTPNPNFEAIFYSGGKLIMSNNKLQIVDLNRNSSSLNECDYENLSASWISRYQHVLKIKEHCLKLEDLLTQFEISSGYPSFPITIGNKRPLSSEPLQKRSEEKENISPVSVQSSRVAGPLEPYEGSVSSMTCTDSEYPRPRRPLTPCQGANILPSNHHHNSDEVFVENIGTACKDNKVISVRFLDGTALEVQECQPSMMIYTDARKGQYSYSKDAIPKALFSKLELFKEAMTKFSPVGRSQASVTRSHPKILKQKLHNKAQAIYSGSSGVRKYFR